MSCLNYVEANLIFVVAVERYDAGFSPRFLVCIKKQKFLTSSTSSTLSLTLKKKKQNMQDGLLSGEKKKRRMLSELQFCDME